MIDAAIFLCDLTGNMARPWAEAGFQCFCVDTQHGIRADRVEPLNNRTGLASSPLVIVQRISDMNAIAKEKKPTFDPSYIRDLSEAVYRIALNRDSGDGAVERMIAKDEDGGEKLRNRAAAYDKLTRAYLEVLGVKP